MLFLQQNINPMYGCDEVNLNDIYIYIGGFVRTAVPEWQVCICRMPVRYYVVF